MQKVTKKIKAVLKSYDFAKATAARKNSPLLRQDSNSFSLNQPPLPQNRDFN